MLVGFSGNNGLHLESQHRLAQLLGASFFQTEISKKINNFYTNNVFDFYKAKIGMENIFEDILELTNGAHNKILGCSFFDIIYHSLLFYTPVYKDFKEDCMDLVLKALSEHNRFDAVGITDYTYNFVKLNRQIQNNLRCLGVNHNKLFSNIFIYHENCNLSYLLNIINQFKENKLLDTNLNC